MSDDINVDLPDEDIEEAIAQKMPVGTEEESVASVDKAETTGKKQKARKGDKLSGKDEPKAQGDGKGKPAHTEDYDFSEDLNALVEGEQTLSDEFKAKTAIIFETAINSKISTIVERLENEYQEKLEEEVSATREDLIEKVDNYLNYVVEQWMEENQVAIEAGLRTEVAEGFMNSLKDLFVESYIDVPESKVDLVDELAQSVETLESKLDEQTGTVLVMSEKLETYQRETIIRESARDLADTEIEKLHSLVESLSFESEESFAHKVKTVKESYFKKEVSLESEETTDEWEVDSIMETNSAMSQYLTAIQKSNK